MFSVSWKSVLRMGKTGGQVGGGGGGGGGKMLEGNAVSLEVQQSTSVVNSTTLCSVTLCLGRIFRIST